MIEEVVTHRGKRHRQKSVTRALGLFLPVLAVIVACCINLLREMTIPVDRPVILVLGSISMLVPFRSELPNTLQKIVGLYMVGVLVDGLSLQYFQVPFLLSHISVSCSMIVVLLCAVGYLCDRTGSDDTVGGVERSGVMGGWMLVFVIVAFHMAFLSVLLHKFYGYGYERDLSVLGRLCLCFLLFITLWEKLGRLRFRQCIGLILAVFCLAMIAVKR